MGRRVNTASADARGDSGDGIAHFARAEVAGAIVLGIATLVALVLANSSLGDSFEALWGVHLGFQFGHAQFEQSLKHWVDDGLMALFFFVVGLEIKREFVVGELSTRRGAALPILVAAGGMIAPAAIYASLNAGGPAEAGWAIPMATDIAFALGVLALVGSRLPASLKVFLSALAIADDLGAIIVIALFYTREISGSWLLAALVPLAVLILMNRRGVQEPLAYLAGGGVLWFCILNSGLHATIAGVIAAMTVPTVARISPQEFTDVCRGTLERIDEVAVPGAHTLADDQPQRLARGLAASAAASQSPLQRLEFALHPFTTFVVLPLFALANAGIQLSGNGPALNWRLSLGIVLGLLVGKPLGITTAAWLAVRTGIASLPEGMTRRHVLGIGIVGGIGFTMSMFISNLAFGSSSVLATQAKAAILGGSLVAGVLGYIVLRTSSSSEEAARA